MKANMIFYTAATLCFYLAELSLVLNFGSLAGAALLCLAMSLLVVGVFFHWYGTTAGRQDREAACSCVSSAAAV